MARERDNFKAGLFVFAGFAVALLVVFLLADLPALFERQQTLKVSFALADGLRGLRPGGIVTLGDQPVGKVVKVEDIYDSGGAIMGSAATRPSGEPRVVGKLVVARLPARVRIHTDAQVELSIPPLGGSGTRLNIRSVGEGDFYNPDAAAPDDRIRALGGGSALTRDLARDLGVEDEQRQQLRDIIGNVRAVSQQAKADLPELAQSAKKILARAEPMLDELQASLTDLKQTLADAKAVVADARKRSPAWLDHVDHITASADESLGTVRQLVKEKEPAVRQTIDNVHQISQTAREKTLAQVTEALDRANAALESLHKTGEAARGIVVGQRPVLERAIANAQLTTDQLKLAAIEIRRSPWRLLYRPDKQELHSDNLYDAARSFALAAGTLDAASKSLQAVAAQQPQDRQQIGPMLDHLESLFKRFEETEAAFWKALKDRPISAEAKSIDAKP
ncbi:MAG: hypothetical protein NTW19_20760 [Planctomycetota bacterium]|nr:hypothetical protein [Planctomycetota bacterium]